MYILVDFANKICLNQNSLREKVMSGTDQID